MDLFGRLRWANRAAMAEYLSSIESQRAMQMTLVAAVATAYFELIALDNELDIVLRTLDTRRESVRQAKLRFDGGLTTEIPYQQAQVEYASTASLVPDLERDIALKEHEISLLAGELERSLLNTHDQFPDLMHVGVPSDLLQRRPDLMAAEQDLKSAMADVGIAWADRFPRLSLSFTAGVENNTFTRFFTGPYWYPVIDLTSPLFAFGKNKARYQAAIEAYNQEKYQYEEKVLEVFKEVNDAVTSYRSAHEKVALMGNLKDASRKYVELALFQYQNGYTNYMDVLDAQRSYFDAEIDYSNSVRDEFLAIIDLYKALGGGWSVPSDEESQDRLKKDRQITPHREIDFTESQALPRMNPCCRLYCHYSVVGKRGEKACLQHHTYLRHHPLQPHLTPHTGASTECTRISIFSSCLAINTLTF